MTGNITIIVLIVLFSLLLTPALATANECLNDDLDADVEWVSSGSASIAWDRTYELVIGEESEEGGDVYTLRADDFDVSLSASAISIEKGGEVRKAILNLNLLEDDRCFDWDSEIKVELTDITTDSHKTPSAQLKFYRRGLPELDITIDATSEDFEEIHVSSDQYAPEEEKTITIDVRNAGDAWIETVKLEVEIGELELKGYNGLEFHDQTIYKNLGCMEKDAEESINFTVIAPAWDGITSPYEINYSISAYAKGFDIKDGQHAANNSLTLTCTDPEIRVVKSVSYDEINMSPCNLMRSNKYSLRELVAGMPEAVIYNVSEWSTVELRVYNVGFYSVRNLNITDSLIPDGFEIAETHTKGSPACVSEETPYSIGYKLFPTKPGKYTFDAPSVEADFYGKDFSWESSGVTITVHGPHINLTKTVAEPEGGAYKVTLNLRNDGDRAAYINLTDTVPAGAGYIEESAEEGIIGGGLPLAEWDLDLCRVDDSHRITVEGVLLPPGTSLEASYLIRPDRFDKLDLPHAEVWFRARNYYEGVVRSSFWAAGAEVVQIWDPSAGGWVTPDNGSGEVDINETAVPTPTPTEPSNSTQFKTSQQVLLNRSDGNQTTLHTSPQLGVTDRLPHQLRGGMQWAGSVVGTVGKMASTIADTSLTVIVILIAVSGFLLAFVLLRTAGPPVSPGT
uniref:DUF11 domain-containing protein n=1 Tax=Candidatus Methanogaster sp. ANME-2c ERB4 TaxID=2759911 RepID=A0A7G9Y3Z5_9EURY|nr:hypothetical protein APGODIHH_00018 [Methanosarcinales archaeon ANME-2c ERB4]